MKRTKTIHRASFRKTWNARHLTPVAMVVTVIFTLVSCEKNDDTISLYQQADSFSKEKAKSENFAKAYDFSRKEGENFMSRYPSSSKCINESSEVKPREPLNQVTVTTSENQGNTQLSSVPSWIPMIVGYLFGRTIDGNAGYQKQPLFSSQNYENQAYREYDITRSKNHDSITPNKSIVERKIAMKSRLPTTSTITRGGFGELTKKQATTQIGSPNFSSRFFGS